MPKKVKRVCPIRSAVRKLRKELRERYGEKAVEDNRVALNSLTSTATRKMLISMDIDIYRSARFMVEKDGSVVIVMPMEVYLVLINSGAISLEHMVKRDMLTHEPGNTDESSPYMLKPDNELLDDIRRSRVNYVNDDDLEYEPGGKELIRKN